MSRGRSFGFGGRAAGQGRRRGPPPAWRRQLGSWTPLLAFSLVVLCVRASLADHYVVPTGSMEPTVEVGDRIFVHKAAFGLRVPLTDVWLGGVEPPERGAVVVLAPPEDEGPVLLKRVVALPGDRVAVRAGRLLLNDRHVPVDLDTQQPALMAIEHLGRRHRIKLLGRGGPDFGPALVPAGKMLVMGDNRGNSRDGRAFGFVDLATLRGLAVAVYVRDGRWGWKQL